MPRLSATPLLALCAVLMTGCGSGGGGGGGDATNPPPAEDNTPPTDVPWASSQGVDGIGAWADLTITGNGVTAVQRFRWIPAGSFTMGSPEDEPGHFVWSDTWSSETQHQVTLTQGFWMADSECTQRMWKAVMNTTPSYFSATGDDGLDLPVEQVSWDDIQGASGFLASLVTRAPTFPGALPTEAQWEYACRAGTTTALYNGAITILGDADAPDLDPIAWYSGNSGVYTGEAAPTPLYNTTSWYANRPDVMHGTHHVKRKTANAWGLYDMLGNVWEWCGDLWQDDLSSTPVVDPTEPESSRVLRGGAWYYYAQNCRAAVRIGVDPASRGDSLGFRLCAPGRPRVVPAPQGVQ